MSRDWLWDKKISIGAAKKILKNPKNKNFIMLASLLLERKNDAKIVFREYIEPLAFCKNWSKIKKAMRKNKWNTQRIILWQAIYEKLKEKYHKSGISFRETKQIVVNELCKNVGNQIRSIRIEQGLSQKGLAKKLNISQQLISRIEKGKENVSLSTLSKIFKALNKKVHISFL